MRMSYSSGSSPAGNSTCAPGGMGGAGGQQVEWFRWAASKPVGLGQSPAHANPCTPRLPTHTQASLPRQPRTLQLVVSRPPALGQRPALARLQQLQHPAALRVPSQPEVHTVQVRKLPLEQLLARARHIRVLRQGWGWAGDRPGNAQQLPLNMQSKCCHPCSELHLPAPRTTTHLRGLEDQPVRLVAQLHGNGRGVEYCCEQQLVARKRLPLCPRFSTPPSCFGDVAANLSSVCPAPPAG